MIEVFLSKDYDKDLLKAYLEYIRKSASRELSYGFNNKEADVNIEDMKYEGDFTHVYGTMSMDYPGCIIICITKNETKVIYGGNFLSGSGLRQAVKETF